MCLYHVFSVFLFLGWQQVDTLSQVGAGLCYPLFQVCFACIGVLTLGFFLTAIGGRLLGLKKKKDICMYRKMYDLRTQSFTNGFIVSVVSFKPYLTPYGLILYIVF